MLIRTLALTALCVSGFNSVSAQAGDFVKIDHRPGIVISVSNGGVWSPGYWVWNGDHQDYVEGHWDRGYRQQRYSQPYYRQEIYQQPYYTQQPYGYGEERHERHHSRKCG